MKTIHETVFRFRIETGTEQVPAYADSSLVEPLVDWEFTYAVDDYDEAIRTARVLARKNHRVRVIDMKEEK